MYYLTAFFPARFFIIYHKIENSILRKLVFIWIGRWEPFGRIGNPGCSFDKRDRRPGTPGEDAAAYARRCRQLSWQTR